MESRVTQERHRRESRPEGWHCVSCKGHRRLRTRGPSVRGGEEKSNKREKERENTEKEGRKMSKVRGSEREREREREVIGGLVSR